MIECVCDHFFLLLVAGTSPVTAFQTLPFLTLSALVHPVLIQIHPAISLTSAAEQDQITTGRLWFHGW